MLLRSKVEVLIEVFGFTDPSLNCQCDVYDVTCHYSDVSRLSYSTDDLHIHRDSRCKDASNENLRCFNEGP